MTVQGQSTSGWYPVRTMDGKTGYMAGNYLTFAQNGSIGTVAYANGGYVNLRQGPSLDYAVVTRVTSGMTVNILDASYEWNYVSVNLGGATEADVLALIAHIQKRVLETSGISLEPEVVRL